MDYNYLTTWEIIKKFIIGWTIIFIFLTIYSCIKYFDFIVAAFIDNIEIWMNDAIPIVITLLGLGYMIKSAFKRTR